MRTIAPLFPCLSVMAFVALSAPAVAHESRPIYIELIETYPQRYHLQWKSPLSESPFNIPTVALQKTCQAQSGLAEVRGPDGVVRRIDYKCPQGLNGEHLTITFQGANPSLSSLVRYRTLSGEQHITVLGPQETTWVIPHAETPSRVARQYALLGIEHIWKGVDHLLFLMCLLWIAGTWRRILITITGFTLAHSATLILSALKVVRLPIPPVEAAIALSIVFVATEIVRGPRESLTWRYPVAVSSLFGLLHGLGFASALSEIGLPQTELMTGLLFFNVGVEIGQMMFAAGVLGSMRLVQRLSDEPGQTNQLAVLPKVVGYAVGVLAVFWLVQRSVAFWPGGLGG